MSYQNEHTKLENKFKIVFFLIKGAVEANRDVKPLATPYHQELPRVIQCRISDVKLWRMMLFDIVAHLEIDAWNPD